MSENSNIVHTLPEEGTAFALAYKDIRNIPELLDSYFEPLGFVRTDSTFALAAYEGKSFGRKITVGCAMRLRHQFVGYDNISFRRYTGLVFEFVLETPLKTRFLMSPTLAYSVRKTSDNNIFTKLVLRILAWNNSRKFRLKQLSHPNFPSDKFSIYTIDSIWASEYLSDVSVIGIFSKINSSWSLRFSPGILSFVVRPSSENITAESINNWIQTSDELIQRAENKPTTVTAELTKSEILANKNPRKAAIRAVLFFFAGIFAVLAFLVAASLVAALVFGEMAAWIAIIFVAIFMPYAMFLVFRDWIKLLK